MDIVWLEDFQALTRERSFSRAARARNVTQPAFSRRVRAMEEWLGVSLFERTSRGVLLTAAGEAFAKDAPDLLARIRAVRTRTREAGQRTARSLRFAATQTLSFSFFPDWILRTGSADLGHVQLNTANMATCEEIMRRGEAEFLLCHGHAAVEMPFAGEMPFVRIGTDRLVALQGRRPDGTLPVPDGPAATRWPYLAYGAATGIGRILGAAAGTLAPGARRETVFTSHLSAALRELAVEGAGVAFLPLSLVSRDLSEGRLKRLLPEDSDIAIDILLFRGREIGQAAERFWRAVSETARG